MAPVKDSKDPDGFQVPVKTVRPTAHVSSLAVSRAKFLSKVSETQKMKPKQSKVQNNKFQGNKKQQLEEKKNDKEKTNIDA